MGEKRQRVFVLCSNVFNLEKEKRFLSEMVMIHYLSTMTGLF